MISVITTSYNSASTIEATLESVARQSYRDIEYIVIDGGSTDATLEILGRYKHIITKFISEPDKGLYDAINKGIKIASGDYIGILNSDDVYASDSTLAYVIDFLKNNPVDAFYGDITYFEGDNPDAISRYYSSALFSPAMLAWGLMPAHTSLFLKADIFKKFGYYKMDYKIAADYEFVCRIFKDQTITYAYLNEVIIRMKSGGVSTKNISNKLIIQKEILRACTENNISTNHAKLLLRYFVKMLDFFRIYNKNS